MSDSVAKTASLAKVKRAASARPRHEKSEPPPLAAEMTAIQLPAGWHWMPARDVGTIQLGRQRSPKNRSAEFPTKYLRAANITEDGLDLNDILEMDFKPDERERYRLQPGDIVLSEASGSASQVGKPAMWSDELPLCCFQNTVIRLRPHGVDSKYLLWLFTHFYRNGVFANVAGGVGINHLSAAKFSQLRLPIAPADEQRRIVAEIEKQFTRLEVGVAALRRVQANLKRYRAAVLKAACEGRLVPTEAELYKSGKQKGKFETGEQLLARILVERRKNWQGRAKYREAAEPDVRAPDFLPDGWTWATWDQIGFSQNGRPFPSAQYTGTGIRLLRPGNLHVSGKVIWNESNTRCLPPAFAQEHADLIVRGRELIMNLTAQSLKDEFLGRVCITADDETCLLNQRLARLTPLVVDPNFILYLLRAWRFRRFVDGLNSGSLIQHMFTSQLAKFCFPLPPLAEQARIVAEVERRLSVVDELEAVVSANLQRATRLRQSILQKAFTGELV